MGGFGGELSSLTVSPANVVNTAAIAAVPPPANVRVYTRTHARTHTHTHTHTLTLLQKVEADWMGLNAGLIGDLKLSQVPLAGTHDAGTRTHTRTHTHTHTHITDDSGAYRIGGDESPDAPEVLGKLPSLLHGIIHDWALCQGKNIDGAPSLVCVCVCVCVSRVRAR